MFILTRETNQKLVIDGDIKIVVLDIKDGEVKIGLDIPDQTTVVEEEDLPTAAS